MNTAKKITIVLACATMTAQASVITQPMKLWYDTQAKYFEESLPIGNGKLGALVYGGPDYNLLYLNDITMWTGKPVNREEDSSSYRWIPEIRKALFAEDYAKADSLQLHVQGHNSEFYQPLGILHFYDQNTGDVRHYYRELDIDSAICHDQYERGGVVYTREYFASNPDQLIALKIRANKVGAINFDVVLSSQLPYQVKAAATDGHHAQLTMTGHVLGEESESMHFCTMLLINTDGESTSDDKKLCIRKATEATVYLVNETSFNGFDKHPVREGAPYLDRVTDRAWHTRNLAYEDIRDRHIADYRKYYSRFTLDLGGKADTVRTTEQQLKEYKGDNRYLEALYTQYGRYLLISSSRTPGVPANLQGLWSPHLRSPWRGNYTVNINLEENYWPAFVSNLAEMAQPLDGFIQALAANGHATAHSYYGVQRGWCSSHNSDIWAMTNPVGEKRESPEWSNWNMGGAWLVTALWDRYLFTRDENYLKTIAYPLLKGASEFMMDWLIPNPKNEKELITAPSTSPENEYKTSQGYHGTTCYGGTADLAIIRELLSNTLQAETVLRKSEDSEIRKGMGTDGALSSAIPSVLSRLHPYTIGHMGDINEWYYDWDDWDFKHRHQSHLIGLYPGHQITVKDTVLSNAAARSLEIKGDQTTGWSTGWRINLWARLHRADKAFHIYQKLLTYVSPDNYQGPDRKRSGGTYPNLFDAHPPFQIDGNFGGTAGVCEMLVQSEAPSALGKPYEIELLPAVPAAWQTGSVSGICTRGGYEVSMNWENGRVVTASVLAKKTGKVILTYNGKTVTKKLKAGKEYQIKD